MKGRQKGIYYPDGFSDKVVSLINLLEANDIHIKNEKSSNGEAASHSKLFQWLVDEKLKELNAPK